MPAPWMRLTRAWLAGAIEVVVEIDRARFQNRRRRIPSIFA